LGNLWATGLYYVLECADFNGLKNLTFVTVKAQAYDAAQTFKPCYKTEQCFHYKRAEITLKIFPTISENERGKAVPLQARRILGS